jgi:putative DNA primase/helicase
MKERPSYITDDAQWEEYQRQQAALNDNDDELEEEQQQQASPSTQQGVPPAPPEIVLRPGEIERIVNETEAALIAEQEAIPVVKRLFRRGGTIVSIGFNIEPTHDEKTVETQLIVQAGDYALTERVAATASFMKYDRRRKKLNRVDPPHNIAVTLKQRKYDLKLPALVAVVNCPQFMANGQIMAEPGFNPATGIFFDPRGVSFPPVPTNPTRAEVRAAFSTILWLYQTFSFEADQDKAVALSLPLTLLARTGMETAPLHAFDAPVAGSGKSKLVSIASIIATGHDAGVIAQGHTAEEFEKRLATQLMKGKQLIAIDNCNSPLDGDLLNQALTQSTLEMRILGESRDIVARCTPVLSSTGNNLIIVGDMTRRGLKGRLDPKTERPELLQFDYDPIADVRRRRGEFVTAALTILRAYCVAGRPGRLPELQSFAEWSDAVRSALVWVGIADPVKTQETLRTNDPIRAALVRVAEAWRTMFGTDPMTASAAIAQAEERTNVGTPANEKWVIANPIINEALMSVAGRNRAINPDALGRYLLKSKDKVLKLDDDVLVRFEKRDTRQGVAVWALADVK